jgi:hypothetical protein
VVIRIHTDPQPASFSLSYGRTRTRYQSSSQVSMAPSVTTLISQTDSFMLWCRHRTRHFAGTVALVGSDEYRYWTRPADVTIIIPPDCPEMPPDVVVAEEDDAYLEDGSPAVLSDLEPVSDGGDSESESSEGFSREELREALRSLGCSVEDAPDSPEMKEASIWEYKWDS